MFALAFTLSGASFADPRLNVQLWGSAGAALVAALVVLGGGAAALGWMATGYFVFAAFAGERVFVLLLALAAAFVPILPRPRRSLAAGLALAAATAIALRVALGAVLPPG